MTERRSKRPTAAPTAKSGEHPAVKAFRAKLDSIDEGTAAKTAELDRELDQFLRDLRTPVPPAPTSKTKP